MLDAFLHGGASVMDFILLGRGPGAAAAINDRLVKRNQVKDIGRIGDDHDRTAALARYMDGLTDAKIVREAQVYRMMMVGCE